jgi:hypothetical protein
MTSNRRQNRRWPRRVQVRFWRPEQPAQVFQGFTSDVSETGAFIVTGTPIGTDARIRVELLTDHGGIVTEAEVRRSHRVQRELQSMKSCGMGVRFLGIAELMHELLPHAEVMAENTNGRRDDRVTAEIDLYAERTISAESIVAAANAAAGTSEPTAPAMMPYPPPAGTAPLRELPVRFRGVEDLRLIYERDLQHGGLFVASVAPPAAGSRVRLALYLPGAAEPVLAEAQVVHVSEPEAPSVRSRNLLTGMGVLFDDPERVLARIRPLLAGSGVMPRSGA